METYPYNNGIREELFLSTNISSGNLTELFTHDELSDKLKKYDGKDILAISTTGTIPCHKTTLKNDLVGCIFYEGKSLGVISTCLQFEKSSVGIYIDKLVDVLLVSHIPNDATKSYRFTFETLGSGVPFEAVATNAAQGYHNVIHDNNYSEMQLRLKSIKDLNSVENEDNEEKISLKVDKSEFSKYMKVAKSGTGTGTGF